MSAFLQKLAEQRMKFLDGLDANEGDINLDIFEDFYPDQAHFVFELLQNAEDVEATGATVTLAEEGCSFEHNGRTFDESDVRAITGIHNSTKTKEQDKIGKFGIGFKSVFVYTQTPTVRSGEFSFKISRLVLPEPIAQDSIIGANTRFELPFDNPKKTPEESFTEVKSGLNELAETTLLFLDHLESIRWEMDQSMSGEVLRIQHSENHFEVLKQVDGKTTTSSHFLKFDQPVSGLEKQRVAVAYALDFLPNIQSFDTNKPLVKQLKIVPAIPGHVAVFFPAEKETSGLRFHLHAPFVPELSRASIKETPANGPLFLQLATLVSASLHEIRDLGLLSADFLNTLPNPQDTLPSRYECIRSAIVEAMNTEPLTPTKLKSHAPAEQLLQAKASLKELLSNDDLEFLVDDHDGSLQWATARALQGTNCERFMKGLAITDWDITQFCKLIENKAGTRFDWKKPDEKFLDWLATKPIEWHQQFYALLYKELTQEGELSQLKHAQIVRLTDGSYSTGSKCYFPGDTLDSSAALPRVDIGVYTSGKRKLQKEDAKNLLENIGVRNVGEVEQVKAILIERYSEEGKSPNRKTYLKDLRRFISFLEKEPDKSTLFKECFIFECADGKWRKPGKVYLDRPNSNTGLEPYYQALGKEANRVALEPNYQNIKISKDKLMWFALQSGVEEKISIFASSEKFVGGFRYG